MLNNVIKRDFSLITILYSLAFSLMLINNGVYWDDWVISGAPAAVNIERFYQTGNVWVGYYHIFILSLPNSALFYHWICFITYLLAGFFLYKTLEDIPAISDLDRFFIVVFFLLFPVNSARITLICSPYALTYASFFLGLYLLKLFFNNGKSLFRFLSLVFLFFSFFIDSHLVFYVVVLLFVIYKNNISLKNIKQIVYCAFHYIDFLILPLIFWIIKVKYRIPYGIYEGYNKVGLNNLFVKPHLFWDAFVNSFIEVLRLTFNVKNIGPGLLISLIIFVSLTKTVWKDTGDKKKTTNSLICIFAGLCLFVLAVYPYLVVGLMPSLISWNSRHQLLIPLGAAFIIYYSITLVLNLFKLGYKPRLLALSLITGLFIITNICCFTDFLRDWYKQLAIMDNMKKSEIMRDNTTFLFRDNCTSLNAMNRDYSYYEYIGQMKMVFGDETRFADREDRYKVAGKEQGIMSYKNSFNSFYLASNYKPVPPEYLVIINQGNSSLQSQSQVTEMVYYNIFKPDKFSALISGVVSLDYYSLKLNPTQKT